MTTDKTTGLAGISWVVLTLAAVFGGGSGYPALAAPAEEIRTYLIDNRSGWLISAAVSTAVLPLLLVFFGRLISRLRNKSDDGTTSVVAMIGITVGVAATFITNGLAIALVLEPSVGAALSADVLQFVWVATFTLTILGNAASGVAVAAIGFAGAASGLSTIAHRAALVIGALIFVIGIGGLVNQSVATLSLGSLLVVAVWVVAVSVGMIRGTGAMDRSVGSVPAV